jgi:hypothetical protein
MRIQRPFFASSIVWAAGAAALAVAGTFGLLQANEPQEHKFSEPGHAAFQTAIANVKGKTMTEIIVDFKPGVVVPPPPPRKCIRRRLRPVGLGSQ